MGGDKSVDMAFCEKSFVGASDGIVSNVPPTELVILAAESRRNGAPLVRLCRWAEGGLRGIGGLVVLEELGDEGEVGDLRLPEDGRRRDEWDMMVRERRRD